MKARKKNSNDDWQEVDYIQLRNSYVISPVDTREFDTLTTEVKTNKQISEEAHWQDVRERAAIAAMQGILSNIGTYEDYPVIEESIKYANALVKQLKQTKQ